MDRHDILTVSFILILPAALLSDMLVHRYLKYGKLPVTASVSLMAAAVFTYRYGFSLWGLRSILLCQFMILAGVVDAVTYEIPDCFPVFIFLTGLIGFQAIPALCGCLLVPLPFLAAAWKNGKIGGGDVKLAAAGGFALGVRGGVCMLVWGLLAGLIWNRIFCRHKQSIPLAPFLAFGCFVSLQSVLV